ncbi:nickel pincer cofactor biosynthesis protein LarB [uncultured Victivallis sp.]|uniref:nickel pincer cofactor biosynthesis protein LarB n=1 Tax=uncultured Victivallis sp. TaxID=354118 RepID=UPI0025FCA1E5|nr:nickel pincer cofactor biosynthesis protein LarB [uncultured Victivallis sp.]
MRAKDKILEEAAAGRLGFVEAVAELAAASGAVGELKEAKIDHAREARCGFPEFVYGAGKSLEQLLEIIPEIHGRTGSVLVTRLPAETGSALVQAFPAGEYDPAARTFRIRDPERRLTGKVLVVTAGSSDHGVAKEALHTLEACGIGAELVADVGVAGIERLFASLDRLRSADVCIVVAGMEGALPSVVGGLVRCPVIAVPTSVGYGAAFGGVAALLGMLNSCASGVTVVNIDNGFGAACAAVRMIRANK